MRPDRIRRANCVIAALAALCLLAGCRIPGSTLGTEPLQLRFSAATQRAIDVERFDRSRRQRGSVPWQEPRRESLVEPIVIVAGEGRLLGD